MNPALPAPRQPDLGVPLVAAPDPVLTVLWWQRASWLVTVHCPCPLLNHFVLSSVIWSDEEGIVHLIYTLVYFLPINIYQSSDNTNNTYSYVMIKIIVSSKKVRWCQIARQTDIQTVPNITSSPRWNIWTVPWGGSTSHVWERRCEAVIYKMLCNIVILYSDSMFLIVCILMYNSASYTLTYIYS